MLSKCANPNCSERFLRLRQGKIFHLSPTPDVEAATGGFAPSLYERFWLCERCCKTMTLVWGGTEAKLVPLPKEPVIKVIAQEAEGEQTARRRRKVAIAAS